MNVKIQYIVTAISILMVCVGSSPAATRTWKNNTTGDWFTAANWNEGAVPVAGDDVVITNTGAYVILSSSTETNLSSLTLSKTLVFTNWNSALNVTNVTIRTNGTMKLPAAFTNDGISNNVYVECATLTISNGGSINTDAKGYSGNITPSSTGSGPGGGCGSASWGGGGGSYGGNGNLGSDRIPGLPTYGSSNMPTQAGSGGGSGSSYSYGGHGGGAIWIKASGMVTVNGAITANGESRPNGGGGSGGGIYIACNILVGTNGIISANGGNGGTANYGGGGGGGRIAVIYDQAAQSNAPVPDIRLSASGGSGYSTSRGGDIGTLYFPDSRFLTENITHIGQWMAQGFTNWSVNSLTISNGWIRFPADGFQLTVTNDVAIMGSSARLEMGGTLWKKGLQIYGNVSGGLNSPVLQIGGNLTLTNSASLYVYSGQTNAATTNYGALVSVGKNMFIATNCWIYPYSHETNGGSALFRMTDLFISTNGGFNANLLGFAGCVGTINAYGPGASVGTLANGGGGGYGGAGGVGVNGTAGPAYGSSNMPTQAGSGGGVNAGGNGGGLVWINASGTVAVNGTITANGGSSAGGSSGGGSGGGIYITCRKLTGTNGIIRANGGNGPVVKCGGGGGGRIAIWRVYDETDGTIQTNVNYGIGGGSGGSNGVVGTIVWGWIPPAGTIIRLF